MAARPRSIIIRSTMRMTRRPIGRTNAKTETLIQTETETKTRRRLKTAGQWRKRRKKQWRRKKRAVAQRPRRLACADGAERHPTMVSPKDLPAKALPMIRPKPLPQEARIARHAPLIGIVMMGIVMMVKGVVMIVTRVVMMVLLDMVTRVMMMMMMTQVVVVEAFPGISSLHMRSMKKKLG